MAKFLFIDGGGVFGIGPCMAIHLASGLDKLSGVGGTSIGSVLAAQIAIGQYPSPEFFHNWMPKIFQHRRLGSPVFRTYHGDKYLNEALRSLFGGTTMCETKIPYFCTAVDMGDMNLKVFSSRNDDDATWPLWEATRASCSAPTFFPSWRGMADGGLFANNATMVGCAWAKKVVGCPFEEMDVFAIGCGDVPSPMGQPRNAIWSVAPWILQACLGGASNRMHDYFARSLPLRSYVRMNFAREPNWKMDNVESMKAAETKWVQSVMDVSKAMSAFLTE
jgi:uncharacterized protein